MMRDSVHRNHRPTMWWSTLEIRDPIPPLAMRPPQKGRRDRWRYSYTSSFGGIRASLRRCVVIFRPIVNSTESLFEVGAGARLGHSAQFATTGFFLRSVISFRYVAGGFRLLEIGFLAISRFGIAAERFRTVTIRVPVCVRAPRIPRGCGSGAGSALVPVSQFFAGWYFSPLASLRGGRMCVVVAREYAGF